MRSIAWSGPEADIDLGAVAANVQTIGARTTGVLMAVVKADGFGHGAVDVASAATAAGADWLGVTSLVEAKELREAGLRGPLLSWLNPVGADFGWAIRSAVDVAVPSVAHLDAVSEVAADLGRPARVHLHTDVGMARDGCSPAEWTELCRLAAVAVRHRLIVPVGVMGHLGCAEQPADPCNERSRRRFAAALLVARGFGISPQLRHLAATAATLTDRRTHFDLSRIGAGLYGIDPSGSTALRPAMTLTAPVVGLREAPAHTLVGYRHAGRTTRQTTLALLPVGYADGLPRAIAEQPAEVLLDGRRCPIVGPVSMDMIVVDTGGARPALGSRAVVFGPGDGGEPTAADWASWSGTIEHEIVTGIGARVRRTTTPAAMPRLLPAVAG